MTEQNKLIIALDFDDTYTANEKLWQAFILLCAYNKNIEVILCTYRHPVEDYDPRFDDLKRLGVQCYFTDGKAKKLFLEERGVSVNIWIDDRPKTVYEDSAWGQASPELAAWREANRAA
jgi:hypothetical protein